jgi:hypothetical protein
MAEAETLTAHGDVPGTLAYISPERLAGDESTAAADVWSVGVMLWESLTGRHPFWQSSMLETARAIEQGAPRLETLRPDLPKRLIELVDRALSLSPSRRPAAAELARALRGAATPRRKKASRTARTALPFDAPRLGSAVLAGVVAAWSAAELPFFPSGWPVGIALAVAALTAFRPRAGLAAALAVPVLPLGNVSLGLALAYAALAAALLALMWREPRGALLLALGPLLAPVAALGLVPLACSRLRAAPRRAAQAALAVFAAWIVAGVRGAALPLTRAAPPLGIGVDGANDPLDVASTLARAAAAHPALLAEAALFGAVAAVLPLVSSRGRWAAAGVGAALLGLGVPLLPLGGALSIALAAWVTAIALALRSEPALLRRLRG